MMQQVAQLPFLEQEIICNKMQFIFDDFVKKFPPYAIKVYKDVFGTLLRETGFTAENKTILEIGPGFSIGVLFLAALSGARKVHAVDAFAHDKGSDHDYILAMYQHLINDHTFFHSAAAVMTEQDFTDRFSSCIAKGADGKFCYRHDRIVFDFPYQVEKLPYDNNMFDCAYSFATFEHFRKPHDAAEELYRVTKPGGISYHSIDLRDHRDFDKPLDFLTIDRDSWERYGSEIVNYSFTNRLRSHEIINCFTDQGFTYLKHIPFLQMSVSNELCKRLHSDYVSLPLSELGILGCIYIFRKPGETA
jgi:SAM-dependent methyltransferase